ncbi:MurR/RpiR family transcriptional regulator [Paraburkholderia sp. DD10]|jgi:DNA-binding MurR/RpiR family transcriptional regulator|uniref:Transcriptional regulator, RpiR family n=1 Tax=Paraburkholderia terricola TaxID=169427 RepID=A0A1M6JH38_9BURK|nr:MULTISPECIES: MurR/RpiR family transcriptional regulator [Paraburkholderia]ORC48776.1 transcriptional regulator [Burkholderia sp. A27]SDN61937.1 transcriptional regulator, RpiR family [Paraburkholderia sediminicola]SHJ46029.1 transcriptional regulator, RpiR family [Paraburkholderia terricola]
MIHHPSVAPNSAEQAIASRIAAAMPTLTPIHRRMGEYVLANLFRAATMRIDELASVVGASVATANRFARTLGFDGYPQFREALVRGFEATLAPVERLRSAQESLAAGDNLIDASLEQAAANLHSTRSAIDSAAAEAAVEAILAARRVFVLGAGTSSFLAGLMEHGLMPYHDNVQSLALIGGPSHAARRLFNSDEGDLVIGIVFPRYVEDTIELARRAASRGARVLALTDSPRSPLAHFADLSLYVRSERRLAANADSAVLAVIEALCDAVAYRAKRSVKAAADVTEFVLPWLTDPQPAPIAAMDKPARASSGAARDKRGASTARTSSATRTSKSKR